jgi:hypothetical protein
MQRFKGIPAILLVLFLAFGHSKAQVAPSPFSTFGFGELISPGLAQNQGMGGLGISNPSSWYLNNQNPALLVFNYVTVFQAGMQVENRRINDGISIAKTGSGNLNYLAIAFPVKSGKWTTSVGLMPYSNTNYNLSYNDNVNGSNFSVTKSSSGKGGISQFYWSNGVRLTKFLSVGAKASYLFSSINSQNTNVIGVNVGNYSTIVTRDAFSGLNFSGGISFHKDSLFGKNYRLNIGAVYSFRSDLSVQRKVTSELKSNSGVVIDSLTLSTISVISSIPQSFGVGLSFGKIDRWLIGADVTFLDYGNYNSYKNIIASQSPNGTGTQYYDVSSTAYRTAIGGEFTPDPTDFTNYLKRMTYRAGVSYDQFPYLVSGNQLHDFGINFGMSLPVGRISSVDLAVKFGRRGALSQNTIEENYFRLYFGITFNDNWFIKRKFD